MLKNAIWGLAFCLGIAAAGWVTGWNPICGYGLAFAYAVLLAVQGYNADENGRLADIYMDKWSDHLTEQIDELEEAESA